MIALAAGGFWDWFAQSHLAILMGVYVGGLLLFHALERFAPIHKTYATGATRRGYLADITATLVDGPLLSGLTKIAAYAGVMAFPQVFRALSDWSVLAQFALFFFVNDFGRYWLHRWYHESDLLWRIHRVHHSVVQMDALSAFRVHVLEGAIKYGVIILPFHLLGVDRSVVLLYSSLDIIKGFWHHANLRTYIGPLNYLLNSAELHWWHHSVEARGQRSNYGSVLSVWDWLFRTAYWPRGEWPDEIGVKDMAQFPDTYVGQLASVALTDEAAVRRYGSADEGAAPRAPGAVDSDSLDRRDGEPAVVSVGQMHLKPTGPLRHDPQLHART